MSPVLGTAGEDGAVEAPAASAPVEHLCFVVRYAKLSSEVRLAVDDAVTDLKAMLFSMTDVPPERQKILGLVRGKLPIDETVLGDLAFPPASLRESPHPTTGEKRVSITLIGTPVDQTFKDPRVLDSRDSQFSWAHHEDIDYSDPRHLEQLENVPLIGNERVLKKLNKVVERHSQTFNIMHPPRDNLRGGLLVLDLDYTIADTRRLLNYKVHAREAERPGLHEFLKAVYPYYDICVWSQTSLFWLEAKLTELGCLTHPDYNISFVLDQTPMFSVHPKIRKDSVVGHAMRAAREQGVQHNKYHHGDDGELFTKHKVKALEVIWRRFPQFYNARNTIHIDDLSRNFALNPSNGLKIKAFRTPKRPGSKAEPVASPDDDRELFALQTYLLQLAHPSVTDFCAWKGHREWKSSTLPSICDKPIDAAKSPQAFVSASASGSAGAGAGAGANTSGTAAAERPQVTTSSASAPTSGPPLDGDAHPDSSAQQQQQPPQEQEQQQ